MQLHLIAGARPNFMKIAPIIDAIKKAQGNGKNISYQLIHTGQHYDANMSGSFFDQLGIPYPDVNFNAGGGSQAEQTSTIMTAYEKLLLTGKPELCIVVGDVTSTMSCSISARKMLVPVAHVEAGIRSGDWSMPEEINRVVTDSITNYFFTTTRTATDNLIRTGANPANVFFVGNTMIDTLLKHRHRFIKPAIWDSAGLQTGNYIVITLHRPANVDDTKNLEILVNEITEHSKGIPLIFPVHPRTLKVISKIGINHPNLHMIEPLGYLEFNYLVERSLAVITDSGGITEETTVMGIPCITLRDNTERPETVEIGTNELIGTNPKAIKTALEKLFNGNWKKGDIPELWDGKAAERIIGHIMEIFRIE